MIKVNIMILLRYFVESVIGNQYFDKTSFIFRSFIIIATLSQKRYYTVSSTGSRSRGSQTGKITKLIPFIFWNPGWNCDTNFLSEKSHWLLRFQGFLKLNLIFLILKIQLIFSCSQNNSTDRVCLRNPSVCSTEPQGATEHTLRIS